MAHSISGRWLLACFKEKRSVLQHVILIYMDRSSPLSVVLFCFPWFQALAVNHGLKILYGKVQIFEREKQLSIHNSLL